MAAGTVKDEKLVGIVPLEPDWSQPGIERLGPPPGNAEILIRGGAGWVFGIPAREETPHPRIERLGKSPSRGEVVTALAREMAWRWYYVRSSTGHADLGAVSKAPKTSVLRVRYADVEDAFVRQIRGFIGGGPSMDWLRAVGFDLPSETSGGADCQCIPGISCCAGTCASCEEG